MCADGRTDACDASCLSLRLSVGAWEAGMDAAPCDPRGTHSDLSLAAAAVEYFGIEEGVGMSSITVRRDASWSSLLSEVVLRKAIIMHRCSAAFFPPPSTPPPPPRVTKKRSVQSTSPLLRVAFPLLLATDIQIKEPASISTLHVGSYQSGGECQQCFSNSRNLLR